MIPQWFFDTMMLRFPWPTLEELQRSLKNELFSSRMITLWEILFGSFFCAGLENVNLFYPRFLNTFRTLHLISSLCAKLALQTVPSRCFNYFRHHNCSILSDSSFFANSSNIRTALAKYPAMMRTERKSPFVH